MGLSGDVTAMFTAVGAEPFTVDVDFSVESGETLVVLGPSGSGKSLLLETVAGFHEHVGTITFDGRDLTTVPPERRDFGFVFQDFALFPHMTVRENVEYGTRYHDQTREVESLLDELGVAALADRYPPTLSGGEKQRVALARSLAIQPKAILLDEPLASLDVPTRQSLRDDLTDVLENVTALYVTHNRTTARAIADHIVVMHDGTVVQSGPAETVFERPASPMVARFTGANVIDIAETPSLQRALDPSLTEGHVAIRPEAVILDPKEGEVRGTVEHVVREDAVFRVTIRVDDSLLDAFVNDPPRVGARLNLRFPQERLHQC